MALVVGAAVGALVAAWRLERFGLDLGGVVIGQLWGGAWGVLGWPLGPRFGFARGRCGMTLEILWVCVRGGVWLRLEHCHASFGALWSCRPLVWFSLGSR